jgi:hypothetical protein
MKHRLPFPRLPLLLAALGLTAALHAEAAFTTPEGRILDESKPAIRLAREGKALVPIVIATNASEAVRKTADDLAASLKRITGADFVIAPGPAPAGLTLGTLAQFPDGAVADALAVRNGYDGLEAFALRSGDGQVRLLANTDLGVAHAASRFLELLGCRWFFQGPAWEIVPALRDLEFNLNETARPDIWSRSIWFGRTSQAWEKGDPDANAAYDRWARGNRMGMSFNFNVSHNWHAIPTAFKDDGYPYKKEFEAHPEYFALVDGKRTPPQFCVANAGLQKTVIRYANRYFEKNPAAHMVSLDTADQGGWCTCADCAKLGPYPCQPFYLANIVAKELQKTHPGKFAGLLAYSWHSDAPDFMLEPNVYVQLTAGMNASTHSFDELFRFWTKKCRSIGIYEYYSYWEMDKCLLPGTGPQNHFDTLAPRMLNYVSNRVHSISGQAASSWGANGLGYYLAAKLMWDSASDTKALRKDFYEKAFGPAAAPMERYFERLNLDVKPLPGAALLRQCIDDLEAASKLAAGRPDILARLAALKENLVYNAIGLKVSVAGKGAGQEPLLDWFTWSYRTRNNYMNDWITFRSTVGRPAAEDMGMTNWFWRNTKDNPWRVDKPVTPEELDSRFAALKADLGDLPATPPVAFSDRYVVVDSGQPEERDTATRIHSGKATYLLSAAPGQPLRLTVTKRDTGWMEKPPAKYTLAAQDGTVITNGSLDTGRHDLQLQVPAPGVYRFTCLRGGKGWEVDFPKETTYGLLFERGEKCNPTAITASWFYVPKGTAEIVMYTVTPSSPIVRAPDKRVARKGASDGRYVALPVKPGEDGTLWTIGGRPSNLWFFNVPTVLSFNRARVFVPEEVAKKDGLTIVP